MNSPSIPRVGKNCVVPGFDVRKIYGFQGGCLFYPNPSLGSQGVTPPPKYVKVFFLRFLAIFQIFGICDGILPKVPKMVL